MTKSTSTTIIMGTKKCKPFLLRVMVFSPEAGYKFNIEVQKACSSENDDVWKLFFDLFKKIDDEFVEIVSVEFVAGTPDEIEKVAAITDQGMTRPQVRAFRDNVFPLVKPVGESGKKILATDNKKIDDVMKIAINAV